MPKNGRFTNYELIFVDVGVKSTFERWWLFYVAFACCGQGGAFDSAKNHKRQHRKRQSVTAKREKSQTPKFL